MEASCITINHYSKEDFSPEAGCEGLLLLLSSHVYHCVYIPSASYFEQLWRSLSTEVL